MINANIRVKNIDGSLLLTSAYCLYSLPWSAHQSSWVHTAGVGVYCVSRLRVHIAVAKTHVHVSLLQCAIAAAQCIVIGRPVCVLATGGCMGGVCLFVCLWVCYHYNSKLRASIHQTGSVGKGSDRLQLIKFWPSRAPREGGLRRGEIVWLRLTTASAQCLHVLQALFSLCFERCTPCFKNVGCFVFHNLKKAKPVFRYNVWHAVSW